MTIRLSNDIPMLYFKSKTPMIGIWFSACGDSVDQYFGPIGLSHMLEHIYVTSHSSYQSNGATFSSSVCFVTYADNRATTATTAELSEFIIGWFFDSTGSVRDRISSHNVKDRISELNNETHIKALQHGESISVIDTLRTGRLCMFSQFDTSFKLDQIRKSLHNLLSYMMSSDRIIIAIAGPEDTRDSLRLQFDKTFGRLGITKIDLPSNPAHLANSFKSLRDDEVLIINNKMHRSVETSILMPVPNNSVLLSQHVNLRPLDCKYGKISLINQHIDLIDSSSTTDHTVCKSYIELRVNHRCVEHQISYRNVFKKLLADVDMQLPDNVSETIGVEDFIMMTPPYTAVHTASLNKTLTRKGAVAIPKESYFVFITSTPSNLPDVSSEKIEFSDIEVPPYDIPRTILMPHMLNNRQEHLCLTDLRRDAASVLALRSTYNRIFFPMSYHNIVAVVLLQTLYPQYFCIERNSLLTPLPYNQLRQFSTILREDLRQSSLPSFLINLRTYSIMEPVFDYDSAIRLFINTPYYTPSFHLQDIYYNPPSASFRNELFVCSWPFSYFIHVLDYQPGSYSEIIRNIYKSSGLIYHGDMTYYGPYTVIRGIMN